MNNFFFETYGCQMNKADSVNVIENLKNNGYFLVDQPEKADFIIINTCSVRKTAENRIWGRLGFYKSLKKITDLTLLIMGCMSQRVGDDFFETGSPVDIVVGTFYKDKIPEILNNHIKGQRLSYIDEKDLLFGDSYPDKDNNKKAFVTISSGCNNFCSYCIVPYLRGKEKSRPSNEIIKDINRLSDMGVIQVTLLGQNVNSYGNDNNDISFAQLLKKICTETDIKWIKYLSSHPKDFNNDLIDTIIKYDKISKWLHLAVQSGSNKILEKMNRHYSRESYIEKIIKLKNYIPDLNITTDIIVGFPDENDFDFMDTIDLIKKIEFNDAYMYKYNIRENTFAAINLNDNVPEELKLERLSKIITLQKDISKKKKIERIGKVCEVISDKFSKKKTNEIMGLTRDEQMIIFKGSYNDFKDIVKLKITKLNGNTLYGEKIN